MLAEIPLIGVNVKVKDSTVGTITDINGNFTPQTRKEIF